MKTREEKLERLFRSYEKIGEKRAISKMLKKIDSMKQGLYKQETNWHKQNTSHFTSFSDNNHDWFVKEDMIKRFDTIIYNLREEMK